MEVDKFLKAKYYCTAVLQLTSAAQMILLDYENEVRKLGFESRQKAKQLINNNAKDAVKLNANLKRLEKELTVKLDEEQEDRFLDDVGFIYKLILLAIDRSGDDDGIRDQILNDILKYESKLNLI